MSRAGFDLSFFSPLFTLSKHAGGAMTGLDFSSFFLPFYLITRLTSLWAGRDDLACASSTERATIQLVLARPQERYFPCYHKRILY